MRKNRQEYARSEFSILALDDDPIMTETLQSFFQDRGYLVDVENDPNAAIERVRTGHYDIMLLDFLMTPICGDQVVERIRQFNRTLFIVLLTGHKSMAPPVRTIRALDIQGYYEKSDRFDQLELLVESCVKSIKQMRLIESYQTHLAELADAMPEIYRLQEPGQIGERILSTARTLWNCRGALLALWSPEGTGHRRFLMGESFVGCESVMPEDVGRTAEAASDGKNLLAAQLSDSRGKALGYLAIDTEKKPDFYGERLFSIFVRQCAASLENTLLAQRVSDGYTEMIKALRLMVDAKDIYTRGHSDRVAFYAEKLAETMGMDADFCERVRIAGLFHDVGKMAVPDEVLLSPEKLSAEAFETIKKHPQCGYSILSAISAFKDIGPIVQSHHERIDGKGYPNGLKGGEIPEEARIIAIADAFDAMTSTRRYRPNLSLEEAIARLTAGRGTQFDSKMVDMFLTVIPKLPTGYLGRTTDINFSAERSAVV